MQRRSFLQSAGVAAASMCALHASGIPSARFSAQRPFTWRDAENRVRVDRVAISPDGSLVALQTEQPMRSGGRFPAVSTDTYVPRGELWLLNRELGAPRRLEAGGRGVWSPSFSPDGRLLAALTIAAPGRIGLVVWELQTGRRKLFLNHNVELFFTAFRSAYSAYAAASTWAGVPHPYLWLNATSILFTDHGSAPQQFDMALSDLSSTVGQLRGRTALGKLSVRVWSDDSQTCGSGGRLARLDCESGEAEILYIGDVRGVSVSPDMRAAALLVATRILRPVPNVPMGYPLGLTTTPGEFMVEMMMTIVDITQRRPAQDIKGIMAVGVVSPQRLPVWSEDGARVSVPVRTTYSDEPFTGDDAAWDVDVDTGHASRWPASSYLDAELLATLLTTFGGDKKSIVEGRPSSIRRSDYHMMVVRGGAWRVGPGRVLFWAAPVLTVIEATRTTRISGDFVSVQPPVFGKSVARTAVVCADGRTSIVTTRAGTSSVQDLVTEPGWDLLDVRASDGAVIYKDVAENGTFLLLVTPEGRPRSSPVCFNTYFRDVLKPRARVLQCSFPDGTIRTGVLQLPVGRRPGERHPVIVYAYPDLTPSVADGLTRVNSNTAVIYPVQHLLTKGFAFFHAPFPISGKTSREPMRAAVDAVLPWLDVLDDQPEIVAQSYGFWGHSNAGYVALALEALTDRFKAIVAWDTFPEIGYWDLHSQPEMIVLNCGGNVVQEVRYLYEDTTQPYVPAPRLPWTNARNYIRNEPLFNLSRASTPLLLIEGELDGAPNEMEEVYSALYARGVPVELAYYWGEDHNFVSPENIRDSWTRTERFFRRYLGTGRS